MPGRPLACLSNALAEKGAVPAGLALLRSSMQTKRKKLSFDTRLDVINSKEKNRILAACRTLRQRGEKAQAKRRVPSDSKNEGKRKMEELVTIPPAAKGEAVPRSSPDEKSGKKRGPLQLNNSRRKRKGKRGSPPGIDPKKRGL